MPKVTRANIVKRETSRSKGSDKKNHSTRSRRESLGSRSANQSGRENGHVGAETFNVPFDKKTIACKKRGSGIPSLLFTHGAGGGIETPAIRDFAQGFSEEKAVVLFEGTMNLKSRIQAFQTVMAYLNKVEALGGRSMGARAAVVAGTQPEHAIQKLVLVSYPLIGGKNQDLRDQILYDLPPNRAVLFVTGSEDCMCPVKTLEKTIRNMKSKVWLIVVEGADHGMSLKKKDAVEAIRIETGKLSAQWMNDVDSIKRRSTLRWDEESARAVLEHLIS